MRLKARPVLTAAVFDNSATAIVVSPDGQRCILGDVMGTIREVDLRTGRVLGNFNGFGGAVRSLALHPTRPYLAACGLDRYARIYTTTTHKARASVYLKQRLNRIIFSSEEEIVPKKIIKVDGVEVKEDDESLWNSFGVTGDKHSIAVAAAAAASIDTLKKEKVVAEAAVIQVSLTTLYIYL